VSAADGKEVPQSEIVKGYEIQPDTFVTLTDEELTSLQPERFARDRDSKIRGCASIWNVLYFDRTSYRGLRKNARKHMRLLNEAMKESRKGGDCQNCAQS